MKEHKTIALICPVIQQLKKSGGKKLSSTTQKGLPAGEGRRKVVFQQSLLTQLLSKLSNTSVTLCAFFPHFLQVTITSSNFLFM